MSNQDILVKSSFNGELRPVDKICVQITIALKLRVIDGTADELDIRFDRESTRTRTIYDMLLSGI